MLNFNCCKSEIFDIFMILPVFVVQVDHHGFLFLFDDISKNVSDPTNIKGGIKLRKPANHLIANSPSSSSLNIDMKIAIASACAY